VHKVPVKLRTMFAPTTYANSDSSKCVVHGLVHFWSLTKLQQHSLLRHHVKR